MAFRFDLGNRFEVFVKRLTSVETTEHSVEVDAERSGESTTKVHHFARIVNEARFGQFRAQAVRVILLDLSICLESIFCNNLSIHRRIKAPLLKDTLWGCCGADELRYLVQIIETEAHRPVVARVEPGSATQ